MPVMCANVARGELISSIEKYINGFDDKRGTGQTGPAGRRSSLLADLNKMRSLTELLAWHAVPGYTKSTGQHLRKHWFDPGADNWWPHNELKEDIVRCGFAEAIRLRKCEENRPVCILWVCAGHHFQVAIHASADKITVLILTPHTPYGTQYPQSKIRTGLSVVGTKREIGQIEREAGHAGGRPGPQDCEELATGVWKAPIFGA